jgi:hypothetical protein
MDVIRLPSKVVSLLWKTVLEHGWFESLILLILIVVSALAELLTKILRKCFNLTRSLGDHLWIAAQGHVSYLLTISFS